MVPYFKYAINLQVLTNPLPKQEIIDHGFNLHVTGPVIKIRK